MAVPRDEWAWSWIGVGAGLFWLARAAEAEIYVALPLVVVGAILLAAGTTGLLWPGDRRATEWSALVGILAGVVALLAAAVLRSLSSLALSATAFAAAVAAGRSALALEPVHDGVPAPKPSLALAAKVAVDDLILGLELASGMRGAMRAEHARVVDEVERCRTFFDRRGLLARPLDYHVVPPALERPEIRLRRIAGRPVEVLRFESGYAPHEGEPGRERWLGYAVNRTAWAYVLRRPEAGRPWLVCTNGYRMGHAAIDVRLFGRFFSGLGANVLIPVLPLHGPRRRAAHSGTGFLGLDVIDTLHAEAQAIWDMRRLLGWIRAQEPSAVGAFGLSLGGYTTALFASIVEGLAAAIPGIPLSDIPRMLARHAVAEDWRAAIAAGFTPESARDVLRPVSPLALAPKVPQTGRMFFGAVADRLVTPDQVRDLWRHWGEPEIVWYQGGHVTFRGEKTVWSTVDRRLRAAGVAVAAPNGEGSA